MLPARYRVYCVAFRILVASPVACGGTSELNRSDSSQAGRAPQAGTSTYGTAGMASVLSGGNGGEGDDSSQGRAAAGGSALAAGSSSIAGTFGGASVGSGVTSAGTAGSAFVPTLPYGAVVGGAPTSAGSAFEGASPSSVKGGAGANSVWGSGTIGGSIATGGTPNTGGMTTTTGGSSGGTSNTGGMTTTIGASSGGTSIAGSTATVSPKSAVSITAGHAHTCVVLTDGSLQCWGSQVSGQLGIGDVGPRVLVPVTIPGILAPKFVSARANQTCVVLDSGEIRCWGEGAWAEFENGVQTITTTPIAIASITNATAVASGERQACAVLASGQVQCWGFTGSALGIGAGLGESTPVVVSNVTTGRDAASGASHSCARLDDGTVWCWGDNSSGQLGDGGTKSSYVPVKVTGIDSATAVTVCGSLSCARLKDKTIRCWGSNSAGQLGDGTTTDRATPVTVSGITTAEAVDASSTHACALLTSGAVQCWGYNQSGELGSGASGSYSALPVLVPDITNATAVAVGGAFTCALLAGGTVKCWGWNSADQLGVHSDTKGSSLVPLTISGITDAVAVDAGGAHVCALLSDASVRCWGSNTNGQLGGGRLSSDRSPTPIPALGITDAAAIATGEDHTCVGLVDGTIKCWGWNSFGQLGNGSMAPITGQPEDSFLPVLVQGVSGATTISAGYKHSCAAFADGTLRCWGQNDSGQLGDGTAMIASLVEIAPVSTIGVANATRISAYRHNCVVLADGRVQCWGSNSNGQLGDGTTHSSSIARTVAGVSDVVDVATGNGYSCAMLLGGTVRCWGTGIPCRDANNLPTDIAGITTAVAIAIGPGHACVVLRGGALKCWGRNSRGELGDGTTDDRSAPVSVEGISNAIAVAAGEDHTCAILEGGKVQCWGSNYFGTLGNGKTVDSLAPVTVSGF